MNKKLDRESEVCGKFLVYLSNILFYNNILINKHVIIVG